MTDLIQYPHFAKPKVHDGKAACPGKPRKRRFLLTEKKPYDF